MTKQEVQGSIERSAGASLVTITQICTWSGRSRDWVRSLVKDLDYIGSPTCKSFYSGDVAARIIERRARQ